MDITENLTALGALFGTMYLQTCFIQNRQKIMELVKQLKIFEEFNTVASMLETEKKCSFYTKVFIFYGLFGNICYLAVPFTNMQVYSCFIFIKKRPILIKENFSMFYDLEYRYL